MFVYSSHHETYETPATGRYKSIAGPCVENAWPTWTGLGFEGTFSNVIPLVDTYDPASPKKLIEGF